MKLSLLIFGIGVVGLIVVVIGTELLEDHQTLLSYGNACMVAEKASMADVNALFYWTLPETREGQCMAACIAEKIGMIKDGKFVPEGTIKGASMLIPPNDPDRESTLDNMRMMVEECRGIENEEKCELIMEIFNCLHD